MQRRLQEHPSIACHYLSLRDRRLTPRLATQFGLPWRHRWRPSSNTCSRNRRSRRLYLLIDEADLFFRDEARNGYPQLSALRALSEEGRCWFMLAGFWDLYAAALLDYQSPLRNGDILAIGGLEPSAYQALATEPLRRLRVGYANDALAERLIEASGLGGQSGRHPLPGASPGGRRTRDRRPPARALESQPVQDALVGWGA
ncbi:hypothetical protein [Delftia sp.]|uniref:hypothetical protein n=1 Tax=Delftia sp. TaxID=1886637 RepID=UPI00259CF9E8|nr:hypothetical protein [Delftia sp.]